MRRVVVTGMGVVSPLGRGVQHNWDALMAGKSGVKKIDDIDLKDIPVSIAGRVPFGEEEPNFNPDSVLPPKDQKKNDRFIMFGMAAADDALKDAGWNVETATEEEKYRAGVMMGAGIGGLQTIYENAISFNEVGMKRISPFFIPSVLINLISGNVSIKHGLKGPNHACVTACSTGTHAIGDATAMIARGDADIMVAGGAESGKVWTTRVNNALFGDYNPYTSPVCGDWFIPSASAHTGDVFLNGKSMYEVGSVAEVEAGEVSVPSWDHEFSVYKWHAEQDEATDETVFYANFQGKDPNNQDVEITVRQACFYPHWLSIYMLFLYSQYIPP